jgi:hypothetical protein
MRIMDRATQRKVIEAMLAEYGLSWTYNDAVPLSEIDVDRSLANNVRTNPLIPDNVDSMVMALKNGADLPPTIMTKEGKKFLVWSGNNRTAAHLGANRKSIPAYIVPANTDHGVLRMIAVEENRGGTWANSKEERLNHALDLLSSESGFTVRAVAQRLDLSESEVNAERAMRAGAARAQRLGVLNSWERITKTSRIKFDQISMDDPYKAAITLAAEAGLKIELSNELINGIKAITTGVEAQMQFIAAKRDEWSDRIAAVRAGMNPDRQKGREYDVRTAVTMAHGHFHKYPTDQIVREVQALPEEARADAIRRIHETANTVAQVALALPLPTPTAAPNGTTGRTQQGRKTAAASKR